MEITITCRGSKSINIRELENFQGNLKKLEKVELEKLKRSIIKHGFTFPVFVWNNSIIDGHQRVYTVKALLDEGYSIGDIPVVEIEAKDRKEAAEKLLILNSHYAKITQEGLYDYINDFRLDISELAGDLNLADFDMKKFIDGLENDSEPSLTDDDAVPDIPEQPETQPGDLYILGEHRLLCGDATNPDHVEMLLEGVDPVLMVTDPPYGVEYDPKWREGCDLGVGKRSTGKVQNDDRVDWTDAYKLSRADVCYVWHAGRHSSEVQKTLEIAGYEIVSQIIWVKHHFVLSRGDYHWQHEPCWYAVKKGNQHNWQGARDQTTTWEIKNNNSFGNSEKEDTWGHGTQKPMECMERPIRNNTQKGDYVYDCFGGSGTTLIACEKTSRKCFMMEIDPVYCDVIVKRWEQYTGAKKEVIKWQNQDQNRSQLNLKN